MLDNMIANFKAKYPTAKAALDYMLTNKTMPNKTAARIFLKAVYGLSKEEAEKMLPTGKRVRSRRYRTAIEREFLGPGPAPTTTVSTAPEKKEEKKEEKEEEKLEESTTQQQPTTKQTTKKK
jgi:Mn-containing catalase